MSDTLDALINDAYATRGARALSALATKAIAFEAHVSALNDDLTAAKFAYEQARAEKDMYRERYNRLSNEITRVKAERQHLLDAIKHEDRKAEDELAQYREFVESLLAEEDFTIYKQVRSMSIIALKARIRRMLAEVPAPKIGDPVLTVGGGLYWEGRAGIVVDIIGQWYVVSFGGLRSWFKRSEIVGDDEKDSC